MILNCKLTSRYKKDLKSYKHKKDILKELAIVINMLENGITLPEKYDNHILTGNYKDNYDCHIKPDDVLIYKITNNELILVRFGSHSKLELTENITKKVGNNMKITIKEDMRNDVYDMEDAIVDALGYEGAFEALTKALGTDALYDNYKYILRVYDIPYGEEDE
jgi:mRNA interferase YafQ